jgi:hypothetical protein
LNSVTKRGLTLAVSALAALGLVACRSAGAATTTPAAASNATVTDGKSAVACAQLEVDRAQLSSLRAQYTALAQEEPDAIASGGLGNIPQQQVQVAGQINALNGQIASLSNECPGG